jgi:serine/threonine protein kinase
MLLVLRSADGQVRRWDLAETAQPAVIGRDSDLATIAVVDTRMSRVHCRILHGADGWMVEDLSSRNGTFVNSAQITRAPLKPGDALKVGDSQFHLEAAEGHEPRDPLVGGKLGGYQIEERLGAGRFGTVYRAMQLNLARPVALKILADRIARDPEVVRQFLIEARRAGSLNHPNLVQVHDVIQVAGRHCMVMELMPGGTVGDRLREDGAQPDGEVRRIMADACAALAFAHDRRLVHRDVKPDNLLIAEDGTYKLADLGIAAPIAADGVAHQERILGSPHYVAPEQARGHPIDGRADLYALGATAFHLLAGRPVFEGRVKDVLAAHCGTAPPDIRRLVPSTPPALAGLIMRLLRKDPSQRPADARAVAHELDLIGKPAVRRPPRLRRRYRPR